MAGEVLKDRLMAPKHTHCFVLFLFFKLAGAQGLWDGVVRAKPGDQVAPEPSERDPQETMWVLPPPTSPQPSTGRRTQEAVLNPQGAGPEAALCPQQALQVQCHHTRHRELAAHGHHLQPVLRLLLKPHCTQVWGGRGRQ